jgi:hypothetical protein
MTLPPAVIRRPVGPILVPAWKMYVSELAIGLFGGVLSGGGDKVMKKFFAYVPG